MKTLVASMAFHTGSKQPAGAGFSVGAGRRGAGTFSAGRGRLAGCETACLRGSGDAGRYSRSFGLSASLASPASWRVASLLRHRSDRPKRKLHPGSAPENPDRSLTSRDPMRIEEGPRPAARSVHDRYRLTISPATGVRRNDLCRETTAEGPA